MAVIRGVVAILVVLGLLVAGPGHLPAVPIAAPGPHRLDRIIPFETEASDGVRLRGHVYLPEGPGPFATILEYSPYWNTAYGPSENQDTVIDGRRTMRKWHGPFMDAGFAVALVNVRGTGESQGCMQWGTPVDWSDTRGVIEALARQPWSNGKIGMFGLSYPGWMQYMALAASPPSLKAVIPASGVIDYYSLLTRNGARLTIAPMASTIFTAGTALGAFAAPVLLTDDRFVPDISLDHALCPRYIEDVVSHARLGVDGERTSYFEARDLRPLLTHSTVPVLVTSGLGAEEGSITQFEGLWDLLHGERRFLLGQWDHELPTRSDFPRMAVAWFDHYLRDGPSLVEPGIVEYQDSAGGWHQATRWPPLASTWTLYPSDGELIEDAAHVRRSARVFRSSGLSTMPLCGTRDYVRYVSAPLPRDLVMAGNFTVNLTLSSTSTEGNLAIHLWDVGGKGSCDDQHTPVARALTTLRHSENPGHGRDFPVNTQKAVSVKSMPFASVVPAGHRLIVTVGGDSPDILPDAVAPLITVHTAPDLVGSLVIPVTR